jgi:hypothetical protein
MGGKNKYFTENQDMTGFQIQGTITANPIINAPNNNQAP